jgi:thiol-disulfide isomerase/thioredoxin
MILSLNSEADINLQNLKKLENLTSQKNTVLLNMANYCHHCQIFKPQWEQFKSSMGSKVNFVEIESTALGKLKDNKKIYKTVTPKDGAVYFPMIIMYFKKGTKSEKKLYEGNRDAESLKKFVDSKTKESKKLTKAEKKAPKKVQSIISEKSLKPEPLKRQGSSHNLSLFEINRELENILYQLNSGNVNYLKTK